MKEKFWSFWPIYIIIPFLFICIYMYQEEAKKLNFIYDMALMGNPSAISIVRKYPKLYKLEFRIVKQAIQGNPYAEKMLKLDEE